MPSTSKCWKCDYESDEESDIKTHIESAHKFRCDLCDFQADLKDDLETHELFEHNNPCPECINTFRTPDKLEHHICKLEVTNPEYGSLYTKNWLDGNGCNSIYCNNLSCEVIILHGKKCVVKDKTCSWTPYTLSEHGNSVTHLELGKYTYECKIRYREILWPKLVESTN